MSDIIDSVTLRYDIAKDLIDTKQKLIIEEINAILTKWNEDSIDTFLDNVKNGLVEEGEHDAIVLTNYIDELNNLKKLLK